MGGSSRNGGTTFATFTSWLGVTEAILALASNAYTTNCWITASGIIQARTGRPRLCRSDAAILRNYGSYDYFLTSNLSTAWMNTVDNITSLMFHFDGATNFNGQACIYAPSTAL